MQQQFFPTSDDILAQHFHTLNIDSRAHDRIPRNFHHPPGGDTGYSGGASYQYSTRSSTTRHSEQYLQPPVVDTRVYPGASGNYPVDPRLAQPVSHAWPCYVRHFLITSWPGSQWQASSFQRSKSLEHIYAWIL